MKHLLLSLCCFLPATSFAKSLNCSVIDTTLSGPERTIVEKTWNTENGHLAESLLGLYKGSTIDIFVNEDRYLSLIINDIEGDSSDMIEMSGEVSVRGSFPARAPKDHLVVDCKLN